LSNLSTYTLYSSPPYIFFFLIIRPPPISTLFPYTTLFRSRLGLLVALTPVLMLFVSFTSAYVMRQGLPTWDTRTNQLVHDWIPRSEEHTSELQSRGHLVCRLLLEKKKE